MQSRITAGSVNGRRCRKSRWLCTLQPMPSRCRTGLLASLILSAACAAGARPAGPSPARAPGGGPSGASGPAAGGRADSLAPGLPAVPAVKGPLQLSVVYPTATDIVDARDSTFLFGSVGTGDATLAINGTVVPVWPNGAWLAWLPLAGDSDATFTLTARTATDSATLVYTMRRVRRFRASGQRGLDRHDLIRPSEPHLVAEGRVPARQCSGG